MENKRFEKTLYIEQDNEVLVTDIFECEFDGTQLKIYKILTNDDSTETKTLVQRQPWKDNPSNVFKNAQDAFDWFENTILRNQG